MVYKLDVEDIEQIGGNGRPDRGVWNVLVRRLLEIRGVEYAWIDVEEHKGARDEMLRLNGGDRRVPTIRFTNGSVLVEPTNAQLTAKLDGRAA